MNRRITIAAAAASAVLVLAACGDGGIVASNDTGTSAVRGANPLATPDQIAAEKLAIELVAAPAVVQAKAALKAQWLAAAQAVGGVPDESLAYLQTAVDESAMSTALSLTNQDLNAPKVISWLAAPHSWFGMDVPGSRTTFDNPDTIYRSFPVDPAARYVIHGTVHRDGPVDTNVSLWDSRHATLANLTGDQLQVSADGRFAITADAGAGDGAGNHVSLPPAAASFFIRDTVAAWGEQQFDDLSVERVSGVSPAAAPTRDAMVAALAAQLTSGGSVFASYNALANAQPVNTIPAVSLGGTAGRLATQAATYSAFRIADDEALVVTVDLGGAKYFIAPAYGRWLITTDYVNHTQSLNNSQAVANPDGTFTFVVSPTDPGVYNWVDTVGIHEGFLNLRWQRLPATSGGAAPAARATLVKLAELRSVLPAATRYVTPAERAAQLAARKASYAPRYSAG
ncbi:MULTISPECIES: hypothetical protein [unclassified Burkholderia]|uniref:hypothetical protein n=1 Tax=unclassified Burkholderia TaxID=2613784 RepID=UPI000753978E|nr:MULTISPECIES: hypothetical protein [unclassified Burkholderia]KVN01781.1 hypothetical protein WT08_25300 [Burkholderia sp. MSMB1552]KWZ56212.1 hypothetical protein WS92_10070 [Burkholderia sp. MSMB1588]